MLFTNPSKLEAVKTEFNSIYLKKIMEQLNKTDVDFIKKIPKSKRRAFSQRSNFKT
jgi:hypothetical protein